LIGKNREELMPGLIAEQKPLTYAYRTVSSSLVWVNDSLKWIFYLAVFLGTFRVLFICFFAIKQRRKEQNEQLPDYSPPLSIIVPAYNEEVGAVSTIASLLNQQYPDFEVVFVDDGSKDKTYERVLEAYGNHPKVQVLTKPNGGKASALNYGLHRCKNDIVVCIDADTQLDSKALYHLAKPFADPKIGAVAGNVKVGNQVNMLTRWQSIEYVTAQNFDRMAFAYLNCITVVPGAIGAFRRQAIGSIGWYETDTLAEDCDLTVRIIRKGYRVTHNNEAIAITESPETYQQFLKQRFRWCFGVMQAFWKSKHVTFNKEYGSLGMVAFPNILLFGLIFPLLAPIADLTLISTILWKLSGYEQPLVNPSFYEKYQLLILYLVSMGIDMCVSAVAFKYQKEPMWKLLLLFPQRLVYRPLMYYVLVKSYIKAIKGELQGWGVLKRTGNIGQVKIAPAPIPTPQPQLGMLIGGKDSTLQTENTHVITPSV
jgi:cellulose synthase/poly-beta-1,6-N-acetylglucosamine synthase-like glycosyltransferase